MSKSVEDRSSCPTCNSDKVWYGTRAIHYETSTQTSDMWCENEHHWIETGFYEKVNKTGEVPPTTQFE